MRSLEEDRAAALCRHQVALRAAKDLDHKDVRTVDRHAYARAVEKADARLNAELAEITARCRRNEYLLQGK
jgi:hypothetical protein